jgi:hypothetical protein
VVHLGRAATRCVWRVCAFAVMPNHLHVALKTPVPNLARGMQVFLRLRLGPGGSPASRRPSLRIA